MTNGNACGAEDGIEGSGEFGFPVADQEAKGADLVTEVGQKVAGSLGGPRRGRVRGHAEQVHPPGVDFHFKQNAEAAQRDGVEGEEIGGQQPGGLRTQEGSPPGVCPTRCGTQPVSCSGAARVVVSVAHFPPHGSTAP
ncbi:MAG: hypothetical protein LC644_11935 [Pseudonocardia sp.]|nr:hypothetical protein [Pseudonocardia sp.]